MSPEKLSALKARIERRKEPSKARPKGPLRGTDTHGVLMALRQAGKAGVTQDEMTHVTWRLAARVHDLRRKYGYEIVTKEQAGTELARYVLKESR
jgi:hypothetical protein